MIRDNEQWIKPKLDRLQRQSLLRQTVQSPNTSGKFIDEFGSIVLNFSTNDYLNLSHRPELTAASIKSLARAGCGGGSSRLMSGTLALHEKLEQATADHKGYPAALLFGSGFLTNIGVIPALAGKVNVAIGTFSKALGNYGGFAACSGNLRAWLVNRARSFIFTTSLPSAVAGGCLAALRLLRSEPALGRELCRRAKRFRSELRKAGLATGQSQSQIIPIMVGSNEKAQRLAARLREKRILTVPVRPPTVPAGTARLRLSISLAHQENDLDFTVAQIREAARAEAII